jgi:hypothetical protein
MNLVKVVHNPAFVEWWSSNFGDSTCGPNPKRIPEWVQALPVSKLQYLMAGLIDSDGCVTSSEEYDSSVSIGLVSEMLVRQVRDVGFKCGVVFNFTESMTCGGKILPAGHVSRDTPFFKLTAYDAESCRKATIVSVKQFEESSIFAEGSPYFKRIDDKVAFKVKSIESVPGRVIVYNFQVAEDHTYQAGWVSTHNCFCYSEEHDPYKSDNPDVVAELKEKGRIESERLFKEFGIIDRDPNYRGWRRIFVLPPDQVIVKKQILSDEPYVEFVPDPETRKAILRSRDNPDIFFQDGREPQMPPPNVPDDIADKLKDSGAIPLDTDPYSGSHVYHLARKKCQYETYGVSILERCINTLLFWDKLRQAQTSIASRHMTPFRIVWAQNLSEPDVVDLREQVDLALTDPDYSIITNYEVHWEEQGSNGRLLQLQTEYEQCENALFAGLGVTRELLTGESTYQGNKLTLEILNKQYLLFREMLQEYVEEYLFKPVAKKKGFIEKDKYGREHLLYPKLSFTRLAIRDNDTFFDQAMRLFEKGSLPVDIILEMLNVDPDAARSKIEADLFTTNDPGFNQFMVSAYQAAANAMVERYNVNQRIADYLSLQETPMPPGGEQPAGGPMGRFSAAGLTPDRQAALNKVIRTLLADPEKLDNVAKKFAKSQPHTKIRKSNAT